MSTCIKLDENALYGTQWIVSYTAVRRGLYHLHIGDTSLKSIEGSPFTITVYPDPTQIGFPISTVSDITTPYGVAINSHDEILVTEWASHQVSVLDPRGKNLQTFGSHGGRPEQMVYPRGVAVNSADAVYVTSEHKLQKFSRDGELIKYVGQRGTGKTEFKYLRGITIHNDLVYVCDRDNHCIQVFDLDLNLIGSKENIHTPCDVAFDFAGNMYVALFSQRKVAVMDSDGHYIREITHEKLGAPSGVHIVGRYMYVSDYGYSCIAVFETSGQFVSSFGKLGNGKGEFRRPHCISCNNGFIYVCDFDNNRIQIF